ncbi:MAG: sn-glycerol-3-phosphate ABC transporter ATP-binding protein UgpC [Actinomycetota bacterium]|nr:sn-glycerol-3-phosphate ABC transporter ATP-binding protein UgpC [Actinomycetota bacterium]
MAEICLEQVSKRYPNGVLAVKSVTIAIADGEFLVLVGPSGCGKTTLLRMIAGLEQITDGIIRIGDRVVNDVSSKDRDIAMIFQNYALYPHMSVAQNIGFALKLRKVPKPIIKEKVREAASLLGLSEWLERKPGQLSGGQRQRVAMGRAIVREPAAFLMDEPLSNLDAKLRVQMRAEVSRLQRRLGVATVYVTHDQMEAMTMGDRVAVMKDGVLQQCDAPQIIYDQPTNVFVAGFIGSPAINLFEAILDADGTDLRLGSQTLALSEVSGTLRPALAAYRGGKVVVGIRPEHLSTQLEAGCPLLDVDVNLVEALGSEQLVHFSIDAPLAFSDSRDQSGLTIKGEGIARVEPRAAIKPGDRRPFTVDTSKLLFFDYESGLAICPSGS